VSTITPLLPQLPPSTVKSAHVVIVLIDHQAPCRLTRIVSAVNLLLPPLQLLAVKL
jgi:hypothetical protein